MSVGSRRLVGSLTLLAAFLLLAAPAADARKKAIDFGILKTKVATASGNMACTAGQRSAATQAVRAWE